MSDKPIKPDITIPESFGGDKAEFSEDMLLNGFPRLEPKVLAADNLNKFIDDTYKANNYALSLGDYVIGHNQITNCILEAPNGVATYSGNTITVKQGLKVLIPNGRNPDGTLKNIEYTVQNDITQTVPNESQDTTIERALLFNKDTQIMVLVKQSNYFEQVAEPNTDGTNAYAWFNPNTNTFSYKLGASDWSIKSWVYLGTFNNTQNGVTSIDAFQPFRAVDYNDTEFMAHQAMPSKKFIALTPQASGKYYVAPADGYFTAVLGFTTNTAFISFQVGQLAIFSHSNITTSGNIGCYIPVSKGNNVNLQYAGGTIIRFSFVYANGATND